MKSLGKANFPVLYAMLVIAALVLTMFGARVYERVTLRQEESYALRSTLAYVQSRIAATDEMGCVSVAEGPEGLSLVLKEGESGYETRIYLCEGMLREELSRCGGPYMPENANPIVSAESFALWTENGLVHVEINGRSALAALRCVGEGGA